MTSRIAIYCMCTTLLLQGCAAGAVSSRSISKPNTMATSLGFRPRGATTPEIRPEVFVAGARRSESFLALADTMTAAGWRVTVMNEHQISLETAIDDTGGILTEALYGIGPRRPIYRVIANGVETKSGTRLMADLWVVAQPGLQEETVTLMRTTRLDQMVLGFLSAAKAAVEHPSASHR